VVSSTSGGQAREGGEERETQREKESGGARECEKESKRKGTGGAKNQNDRTEIPQKLGRCVGVMGRTIDCSIHPMTRHVIHHTSATF
jgi:hypothetical protein